MYPSNNNLKSRKKESISKIENSMKKPHLTHHGSGFPTGAYNFLITGFCGGL
jgi:hypothetical protein